MNVKTALKNYRDCMSKIKAYGFAQNVIYYDASTAAPELSFKKRSEAVGILSKEEYKIEMGAKMKNAVAFLMDNLDKLSDKDKREIEYYNRELEYISSIPENEYIEYAVLINDAEAIWHKAKSENDFESFRPYLEKVFDMKIRFAKYYKPDEKPYNVALSQYERGLDMESADKFFAGIREKIVPLIKKISASNAPDDSFLFKNYPIEKQREFSDELMKMIGIDRRRCSIGETEHPFTIEMGTDDVRITTHYYEDNVVSSMYSVIHEGGHALYELGCSKEYENTALSGGVSMGFHESQSRLYENMIGRSKEFIHLVYPVMKKLFPTQLKGITEDALYKAVNKSEPSLIRTEADELTYPLHIMVRYEIEKGVFEGKYKVKDLPEIFNSKMKEYLGVDVPSDKEGVLQDSHWSGGGIGYFPSYALGSAYAAQFVSVMEKDFGFYKAIENNNIGKITGWLDEKIHCHSCRYDPEELFEMVCGKKFDPSYYIDYLEAKYKDVYGI